ncbi:hypothetical protein [Xanthomonas sp.]|uniref:hypothetical protein n=1 Tax=Xanthomonas sp. TaxID=29446 RepID=UPI001F129D4A|nr:hypothetical protein [Xanthomonas sp.]
MLRSRFVLGRASDDPHRDAGDAIGLGLMQHCCTAFAFLARFLPSLYYGEHANGEAVPLPW